MLRQIATRPLGLPSRSDVLIVYNDADIAGRASAEILRRGLEPETKVEFFRASKERIPHPDSLKNRHVYLVDLMCIFESAPLVKQLIVISHHQPNCHRNCPVHVVFLSGSPIRIAWQHVFDPAPLPLPLELLAKYDEWDYATDPRVLPFQFGMRARPNGPHAPIWDLLLQNCHSARDRVSQVIDEGETVLAYERLRSQRMMKRAAHEVRIPVLHTPHELTVVAANTWSMGPVRFESVWDPLRFDAMCAYHRLSDGRWRVAIYGPDPHPEAYRALAEKYDGEAHARSVLFYTPRLPWE